MLFSNFKNIFLDRIVFNVIYILIIPIFLFLYIAIPIKGISIILLISFVVVLISYPIYFLNKVLKKYYDYNSSYVFGVFLNIFISGLLITLFTYLRFPLFLSLLIVALVSTFISLTLIFNIKKGTDYLYLFLYFYLLSFASILSHFLLQMPFFNLITDNLYKIFSVLLLSNYIRITFDSIFNLIIICVLSIIISSLVFSLIFTLKVNIARIFNTIQPKDDYGDYDYYANLEDYGFENIKKHKQSIIKEYEKDNEDNEDYEDYEEEIEDDEQD